MNITVLGAGLVGAPMAEDLSDEKTFSVNVVDLNENNLNRIKNEKINKIQADLSDKSKLSQLISGADIIVNAVPGFMGYETLKTVLENKKDIVDIAFFEEDATNLDELAKEKGVSAIVDCGVAPGMSNLLSAYATNQMDQAESIEIYVGGLPKVRQWPYEYKAVFSPIDVIEEYTRPARYVEHGQLVVREALSDSEYLQFDEVGTLEAFNTDGLRSLINSLDVPNMKEKTLRYPGHIQKMAVLRETGFFDKNPVDIKGVQVSPLDFTSKLLFPKWKLEEGEVDITVMRIIVSGIKDGKIIQWRYDLHDELDPATGVHSMARTTGYTATVAVRMTAEKVYNEKGLIYPEKLGDKQECVDYMLDGLAKRKVIYKKTVS